MEKDNSTEVLRILTIALNIPVTRTSISNELQKHPEYNTLLGLSDVLDNWGVPNAAYNLPFEKLSEVPCPFIAFCYYKEFAVVSHLNESTVTLSNDRWDNKVITVNEFRRMYSQSILIAEKETLSGEPDYSKKRRKEIVDRLRIPAFLSISFILLVCYLMTRSSYISGFTLQIALLTLFKTTGVITTILLLVQSIDANNPLIKRMCGGDKNQNCNSILSSNAAKMTQEISWSEIGFFYFAGTWLALIFTGNNRELMHILAILNMISLPYTFYSIYYQWRIAKQWCIFCCTVQGLLWLEFFSFLPHAFQRGELPGLTQWVDLLTCLSMPLLVWMVIKPYLIKAKQIAPLKKQLRKFKFNNGLFEKILKEEMEYTLPPNDHSLIIGSKDAEQVITMISDPYCEPCSLAHYKLNAWLKNRPDIKLQLIFATPTDEKDKKYLVAEHLMTLQYSYDESQLKNAANEWYEQLNKNYSSWAKKHPINHSPAVSQFLKTQREWCKLMQIEITPSLFINGRKLPQNYKPEDLKYLI